MAGFGDNTTTFMRAATIPGGMRIEAGCWTQTADASLHIPTGLTEVFCVVCGSEGLADVPCVSDGFLSGALVTGGKVVNYIAVGF